MTYELGHATEVAQATKWQTVLKLWYIQFDGEAKPQAIPLGVLIGISGPPTSLVVEHVL